MPEELPMAGNPQVLGLLQEVLDSGRTPEEVCRDCPDLLPEVRRRWEDFCQIDAEVGALLPGLRTISDVDAATSAPPSADLPHVPGYELLGEVGRGGMGVIHRARDLALERDVAVKLLQDRYPANSPLARRFTDEARITAQLQHPGVPAVYRVGAIPDGRPFLAMKLIKGHTLADLLARRPDPAADRGQFVAIFEHVCQAVAYAHSLRVIHRDLKPSNVMVGKFGEIQVMDWGLAKVLPTGGPTAVLVPKRAVGDGTVIRTRRAGGGDTPGGSGCPTAETREGSVLGTPAYMAPEQAGGEVDRLDPRCDVFGLGAVLCEILTGKPPYTGRDESQVLRRAMAANQVDTQVRLDGCAAEPELVALCQRCLAEEPDDRPRDAGEVAEAVAALRAEAEDRARRAELDRVRTAEQGKRRRVLLAASGIIAVVLMAGLSVSLWQTHRALRAEAAAISSADQARLNAEEAERNARQAAAGRDAKAAALAAEQRARRDETKAREQAFAALRSMTAEVVERKFAQGTALTEDDRAFLRGVIAQFDAFAAIKGDDAVSRAVRAEGRFRVGTMRYGLGEFQEAEQDYDQAVSIYKQLAADFPLRPEFRQNLATIQNNRGSLLGSKGRLREAEQDYDQALALREQLAAEVPSHPGYRGDLAASYNNRDRLLYTLRRLSEAEQDYDQAVSIYKQLAAEFPARRDFHHNLARSHIGRGALLTNAGRLEKAGQDYDQAVSIVKQLLADSPSRPEFRQDLATSHNNRGNLLRDTGRLQEAEQDYDQALSLRQQLAADFPNRPDLRNELAGTYGNLADLRERQGNWAAAKRLLLEGRPHHLAALKANDRDPSYRQFYRSHLGMLTAAHAALLEPEEAVRTAETCRDLRWDAPRDAYDAACAMSQCVPIVAKQERLGDGQRQEARRFYGDAAMKLLRDAVSKGFKDVAHMTKDTDLDPLRSREDFQKFVAELEGKGK
jgi:serine/threonine protein kinase